MKTKKRICLTLSESALEILDKEKKNKYTKGRSQVIEELLEEVRDRELAE